MASNELLKYLRSCDQRSPVVFPPYVAKKFNWSMEEFTARLCDIHREYPKMRVLANMLHLNPAPHPMYFEVCDTKYRRGNTIPTAGLWDHCLSNQKKDQHISVFTHDRKWIEEVESRGKVASAAGEMVGMDFVYLELDRKVTTDGTSAKTKAILDASYIVGTFGHPDHIVAWFSGNNSVHIMVDGALFGNPIGPAKLYTGRGRTAYNLAHRLAGDVRHGNGLIDPWIADYDTVKLAYDKLRLGPEHDQRQALENIDPNLYSINSLIRMPFSYHEKSGGQKRMLDLPMCTFLPNKPVVFEPTPPYLLYKFYESIDPTVKRRRPTKTYDEDLIISTYAEWFDDFDPDDADADGWVRELYCPFYDDHNPGVSINIQSGRLHDFGSPAFQMSFEEFLTYIKHDRTS
jgi:hypothetical protein